MLPYLNRDSVLILDNMKSHHTKAAKDLLDQAEVHYIYLPPSGPDLNPIEKLWSKGTVLLKNSIRKIPQSRSNSAFAGFLGEEKRNRRGG